MPIGLPEIAILLVVLLIVFGPKKLPGLGRGLGSGMREFKDGIAGKDENAEREQIAASQSAPVTPSAPAATAVPTGEPAKPADAVARPESPDPAAAPVSDPDAPAARPEQ